MPGALGFSARVPLAPAKQSENAMSDNTIVISNKTISDGGKVSVMYALNAKGLDALKEIILDVDTENPVQFLSNARIQIACASFLDVSSQMELFSKLKKRAAIIKADAESKISNNMISPTYLHQLVLDNSICEYNNFINLLEGLERGSNS